MRTEKKIHSAMKKIIFTLPFEMKENFLVGVVGVKRLFGKCKQTTARSRGKCLGDNNAGNY